MPRLSMLTRCRSAIAAVLAAMALVGCGGGPPPGWTEPFLLATTTGTATGLRMVWTGGTRTLVVWETEEAGIRRVQALWVPARRLEAPMTLDTPGPGVPREPDVAMDAQGRVVVVWRQEQGGANRVWARRFEPATGWAPAEVLDAAAVGNDLAPRVAMHGNGSALVVWTRGSGGPVMSRAFQPGPGWGPERQLDTSAGATRSPAVTLDGQGRGMVVWPQGDDIFDGPFPPWSRDVDLTTGAGTTTRVESIGPDASLQQLVTLGDGSVLLAWRAFLGPAVELVATSRFHPGSGWSVPLQPTGSGVFVAGVAAISLAAGPGSTSAVMWTETQSGRNRLGLNRLVGAQVSSGTPLIVADEPDTVRLVPQVVLDASGRAIWIWQQGPAGASALWTSDQVEGVAPASPVRLDQGASAGVSSAGLALRTADEALAIWTQNTASGARIWGARRIP
jgi:hypothetical protein